MKKLCGECSKRAVEPIAVAGRRSPFCNFPDLEIPADLAIPTWSNCGAEWIDGPTAEKLDAALAAQGSQVDQGRAAGHRGAERDHESA